MASIAFSCQIDIPPNILRVHLVESFQEMLKILLNRMHEYSVSEEVSKAETCSNWLIKVHHIGIIVPRVVISDEVKSIMHARRIVDIVIWAILCEQCYL